METLVSGMSNKEVEELKRKVTETGFSTETTRAAGCLIASNPKLVLIESMGSYLAVAKGSEMQKHIRDIVEKRPKPPVVKPKVEEPKKKSRFGRKR